MDTLTLEKYSRSSIYDGQRTLIYFCISNLLWVVLNYREFGVNFVKSNTSCC